MIVDFRKIQVENIEGKLQDLDLSKQLGNAIYNQTKDLGEVEMARSMYNEGEVDLKKEQIEAIKGYLKEYPIIMRNAIEKMFSE